MFLGRVINLFKSCLFPIFCLGCNQEGVWLCNNCYQKLDPAGVFCCPYCHSQNNTGICCPDCLKKSSLDQVISVLEYQENKLSSKVIENYKYNFIEDLSKIFEDLINEWLSLNKITCSESIIVPVPLHAKRLAERGFNQAEVLAGILSKSTGLNVEKLLRRNRYTKQQAKLNKIERQANVQAAFDLTSNFIPRKVILVDDVFTTGSTMQECAKILKQAGVKEVIGFTLARG